MMCDNCGKISRSGNNVSHSNVHTKRLFRPNIQKVQILVDGKPRKVKYCTRCIRTMAKAPRGM